MKNFFKRILSLLLSICIVLSCSVVGFAAGAVAGAVLKTIGGYLVTKLADYVWDTATGPEAQAQYAADKIAVLSVIRDWCVENNYNPDCPEFQQFILDMYLEAPDNDEMTTRYGSDWGDLHSQVHPYFAKLSSLYQCGWEEAYNWIVEHYNDDVTKLNPDGSVQITGKDFNDFIDKADTQYSPKNAAGKMSYWTDKYWHNKYGATTTEMLDGYGTWSLYDSLNGFNAVGGGNEIYFVSFYCDGEKTMFSKYQFHFTVEVIENWASDRDEIESYDYKVFAEVWNNLEGSQDNSVVFIDNESHSSSWSCFRFTPYSRVDGYNHSKCLTFYSSFLNYVNYNVSDYRGLSKFPSDTFIFYDPESLLSYNGNDIWKNFQPYKKPDKSTDFGYVASTTPIVTTFNIDTQKIPDNYYVTVSGDTVYDYYIINPETGQSDTINNYITNNYTYVTNPDSGGSGGGSGGGVGGNVNVGGNISVGGQVDVNVNINQGSGAGGNGTVVNPDDILNGSSVDLDKYYDDAISQASGVRSFLSQFFDFLPAEIIGLLGMLIAVAIVCRIFGR